ncbi:DNA replication complex GINS family protein [Candidatus Woesearchaeota archaeon]|nr:DNA replication complex GINS family protein [Candidatus Woesearchaeota archaeon]
MGDDIELSYETLFDLLRREKSREELQEIDPSLFEKAAKYIIKKQDILHTGKLSMEDMEKLSLQLRNVRKIVEDLYHRREKKIMDMALIKSRTKDSIISTRFLLPNEEDVLGRVSTILLDQFRSVIEKDLPVFSSPPGLSYGIAPRPGIQQVLAAVPAAQPVQESAAATPAKAASPREEAKEPGQSLSEPKAFKESVSFSQKKVVVRFITPTPKFVGPNLEIYGPFQEQDMISLPEPIAEILLEQRKAEKVES